MGQRKFNPKTHSQLPRTPTPNYVCSLKNRTAKYLPCFYYIFPNVYLSHVCTMICINDNANILCGMYYDIRKHFGVSHVLCNKYYMLINSIPIFSGHKVRDLSKTLQQISDKSCYLNHNQLTPMLRNFSSTLLSR